MGSTALEKKGGVGDGRLRSLRAASPFPPVGWGEGGEEAAAVR
eukprot:COSAG01_NODE_3740_length_5746_cov_2.375421_10_plen_43_part_00